MKAVAIVDKLLEAEPELMGEVDRYMETAAFDRGAADILHDARDLYRRLLKDNTLPTLLQEHPFDEEAIAQAIIRRALERRGSPGAQRAYKRLLRLGHASF
jgi:hypothetical protein